MNDRDFPTSAPARGLHPIWLSILIAGALTRVVMLNLPLFTAAGHPQVPADQAIVETAEIPQFEGRAAPETAPPHGRFETTRTRWLAEREPPGASSG